MRHYFHVPRWRLIRCWVAQGGICALCERPMPKLGKVVDYRWVPNEDHVIPKSEGGRDDSTNVVATHAHCNSKKGNLPAPVHELKYLAMCQVDSKVIDAAAYSIAMLLHNDDPEAAKVPRNLEFY